MDKKNIIRQALYMFMPVLIFKYLYGQFDIAIAMIVAIAINILLMVYNYKQKGKVGNSLLIGLCGIIFSLFGYMFTDNERYYFIPANIEYFVFIILIIVFIAKKKCYVYLFIKDFQVPYLDEMDESEFLTINYIWLFLFIIRFSLRFVSLFILDLSFEALYWIAFIAGDPITIPVLYYTYRYFYKKINAYYNEKYVKKIE